MTTVQTELASLSQENVSLDSQLVKLRLENQQKNEQESNDVVSLTRELRELRGDLERVRMEREEWEEEAGRERAKREQLEEDVRGLERRLMDAEERRDKAEDGWRKEEKRAGNLEDVLGEFQAGESWVRWVRALRPLWLRAIREFHSQGPGDQSGDERVGKSTSICRYLACRVQVASSRRRGE